MISHILSLSRRCASLASLAGLAIFAVACGGGDSATPPTASATNPPVAAATAAPATTPAATSTPAPTPTATPAATATATTATTTTASASPAAGEWPEIAPASFKITFETSKGNFVAEFTKDWAPIGVQRVYDLARTGFFDEVRFFRVLPGFVVQFGISGNPQVQQKWEIKKLLDDPVKQTNAPGTITFAKANTPNSRSTQLFINYGDNKNLDMTGFAPVGRVVSGMDVVGTINSEYGDGPSSQQPAIQMEGNPFLARLFPRLDYIKKATLSK